MTAYAASDRYALDLRGLGIVWTTEAWTATISSITPAPSYRVGLVGVGGTLRASIGVLDTRSKAGGLGFSLAGDTALELLRAGGEPVRPAGATASLVAPMGSYITAGVAELSFSAQLAAGRYIVGAEVIEVGSELDATGGIYRYDVTRGVRGSLASARPVYWGPQDDLKQAPFPVADQTSPTPQQLRAHLLDLVYPDLQPPTLTGWPVRLWRQTGAGTPVVVYEGVIGRIRSQGATVTVETAPRVDGDLTRTFAVPAGGWLGGTARGGLQIPARATLAWEVVVQRNSLESLAAAGVGTIGRARGPSGGPVVAFPRASLPSPRGSAVHIVLESGQWVTCPILAWLDVPFVMTSDDRGEQTITSPRYWYAELTQAGPGAALVVAVGDGGQGTQIEPAGIRYATMSEDGVARSYRWLDLFGGTLTGITVRFRVARRLLEDTRPDVREASARTFGVSGIYLLPEPRSTRWFPEAPALDAAVGARMGGELLAAQGNGGIPGTFWQAQLRLPPLGKSVGEVIDAHLGPLARALSVSPLGAPSVIDWTLTGQGIGTIIGADDLLGDVALEVGERGRLSAVELTARLDTIAVQAVGGSLSPRGTRLKRDLSPFLLPATEDGDRTPDLAAMWGALMSRYRGTVPVATFRVRDDGTGKVQGLRPGGRLVLSDPVCPAADGTRGLSSAVCVVLEVALDTTARAADVTALVIDYGVPLPGLWGPSVRINANASGTDVLLSVAPIANARGLERFAEIIEAAGAGVAAVLWEDAGETLVTGITLLDADPEEGTIRAQKSVSHPYVAGEVLTLAAFPPAAAVAGAVGYYGRSRWL